MEERTIERAPGWDKVALKFVEDRATDAAAAGEQLAAGAQNIGGKALVGAQDLGGAAAQGAGALADTVGKGAQDAAKALESIDLGKVAESLPFKFPFGR